MEVERDGWIIPKNQTTNFKVLGLSPVLVLSAYHGKKKKQRSTREHNILTP